MKICFSKINFHHKSMTYVFNYCTERYYKPISLFLFEIQCLRTLGFGSELWNGLFSKNGNSFLPPFYYNEYNFPLLNYIKVILMDPRMGETGN